VGPCTQQYSHHYLYIYANGWTVRNNDDINDHRQPNRYANVYGSGTNLFGRYADCIAYDFQ
jgi:hypothetical protein